MSKTLRIAATLAILATAGGAISSVAIAREGTARSQGHGVKCYTNASGQRVCYRGV